MDELILNPTKLPTQSAVPKCAGLASAQQPGHLKELQNILNQRSKEERSPIIRAITGPSKFYLSVLSLARPGFSSLCSVPLLDL